MKNKKVWISIVASVCIALVATVGIIAAATVSTAITETVGGLKSYRINNDWGGAAKMSNDGGENWVNLTMDTVTASEAASSTFFSDVSREIRYDAGEGNMIQALRIGSSVGTIIPISTYKPVDSSPYGTLTCRAYYTDTKKQFVTLDVKGATATSIYLSVVKYSTNFAFIENAGEGDEPAAPSLANRPWFDASGKLIIEDIYYTENGFNCTLPTDGDMETWSLATDGDKKNPFSGRKFLGWFTTPDFTTESKITKITTDFTGSLTIYAQW